MWAQTAVSVFDDDQDQIPTFVGGMFVDLDDYTSVSAVQATNRNGQPLSPPVWQLVAKAVGGQLGDARLLGQFESESQALAVARVLLGAVSIEGV